MEKIIFRIIAGVLLITVLFLLIVSDGAGRQLSQLSDLSVVQPLPSVPDIAAELIVFRRDVFNVLVCVFTPLGGGLSGSSSDFVGKDQPGIFFLITVSGTGDVNILNIPAGTRTLVRENSMDVAIPAYRYDTPVAAYQLGLVTGNAQDRLLEAVENVLFGVEVHRIVTMDIDDIVMLIDILGGIMVPRDHFSLAMGGSSEGGAVRLDGIGVRGYILANGSGTDTGALDRQNRAFAALLVQITAKGWSFTDFATVLDSDFSHNLTDQDIDALKFAFEDMTEQRVIQNSVDTLWGEARIVDGQSWLPDRARIKRFVLEWFYAPSAT